MGLAPTATDVLALDGFTPAAVRMPRAPLAGTLISQGLSGPWFTPGGERHDRQLSCVVGIPVRNEAECIGACLAALSAQTGIAPGSFGVLLFLNHCTDSTREIVDGFAAGLACRLRVVEGRTGQPSAGWARRMALEAASSWMAETGGHDGVLLTSDADSRVDEDWVARNVAAIAAGADAVAGRIALDEVEAAALPEALHARGRLERDYELLLTEIGARIDPEPGNPWPCHWSRSGATIAVKAAVYRAVGGMPDMPCGEDRAFVDAVRAAGFVVRHDPEIVVVTSGRLDGRAAGGVAETIKLRCERPEAPCDDRLEPLSRFLFRSLVGRMLRSRYACRRPGPLWPWAMALALPVATVRTLLALPLRAEADAAIEAASPRLAFHPLRPSALPLHIRWAARAAWLLRAVARRRSTTGRGTVPIAPAPAPVPVA